MAQQVRALQKDEFDLTRVPFLIQHLWSFS